jgi:hypothetical protein
MVRLSVIANRSPCLLRAWERLETHVPTSPAGTLDRCTLIAAGRATSALS